jgi:triacylglycerol esterase/lipase EstA (alpha/beta hydrolase family)
MSARQKAAGIGHFALLPSTGITANVTPTATAAVPIPNARYLVVQAALTVASGGGTVDVYIQTSLDGGATWIDIMNFHFTTSTAMKVSAVVDSTALAAAVAPTDVSLSANTILSGLLGGSLRAKYTSGGTAYGAGTTLQVDAIAKAA